MDRGSEVILSLPEVWENDKSSCGVVDARTWYMEVI